MELNEYIKQKRPTLGASSIVTYSSVLRSLYFRVFKSKDIDVTKYDDTTAILTALKDVPPNKRKTTLSALVIITGNPIYRDQMMDDIKQYNKDIATQEKSPSQEANWITMNEVKTVFDALTKQANLLYKKANLSVKDLQDIQSMIIVALLGGMFIAPRRSLDYCNFKIKEIDPAMNYLDKKQMCFHSYKTAKVYGKQCIDVPPPLLKILKKWISINKTDFLLFDTTGKKLTPVKLNQRLNKIFDGRKISVNALRHGYLTDKYGDMIQKNKEIDETMTDMGSSKSMLNTYLKKE
jgi:hypothetical protein